MNSAATIPLAALIVLGGWMAPSTAHAQNAFGTVNPWGPAGAVAVDDHQSDSNSSDDDLLGAPQMALGTYMPSEAAWRLGAPRSNPLLGGPPDYESQFMAVFRSHTQIGSDVSRFGTPSPNAIGDLLLPASDNEARGSQQLPLSHRTKNGQLQAKSTNARRNGTQALLTPANAMARSEAPSTIYRSPW